MSVSVNRIWSHINFSHAWAEADTSLLDDISQSWFDRRETLIANSTDYEEFMTRLKRRHAIETGIVERMYDIEKGVTETLIKEGFVSSLVSHRDANIDKTQLFNHLQDHLDAVQFVFDVVKDERPLSNSFIKELHQLTTKHQEFAEGRDPKGNKVNIPLLRGSYKTKENNPTRPDGTIVLYCPPDHVAAEMDKLMEIYHELEARETHPLIIAAWVHHAFTTIHPFQDGNGRVVRLIASLILIKHNYFPITVLRDEAKDKYIYSLELADEGDPQPLVSYFGMIQRRNIEQALNIKEVASTNLKDVTGILRSKLLQQRLVEAKELNLRMSSKRLELFELCYSYLNEFKATLEEGFDGSVLVYIGSGRPDDITRQHYYYQQIVKYASQHDYFFNQKLPKSYFIFGVDLKDGRKYELGITIHHYGYDQSTIAIGGFLEYKGAAVKEDAITTLPLDLRPYMISVNDEITPKQKNIRAHLESMLTVAMAQIASEI